MWLCSDSRQSADACCGVGRADSPAGTASRAGADSCTGAARCPGPPLLRGPAARRPAANARQPRSRQQHDGGPTRGPLQPQPNNPQQGMGMVPRQHERLPSSSPGGQAEMRSALSRGAGTSSGSARLASCMLYSASGGSRRCRMAADASGPRSPRSSRSVTCWITRRWSCTHEGYQQTAAPAG